MRRKIVLRAASGLFEPGRGDASLVTDYAYAVNPSGIGLLTAITVYKPAAQGGALNMSRTYDRRGKLVATTQSVSAPTAHAGDGTRNAVFWLGRQRLMIWNSRSTAGTSVSEHRCSIAT